MSKIKELKSENSSNINIFEMISTICDGKSKYIETLLRIVKKQNEDKLDVKEFKSKLINDFKIKKEYIDTINENDFIYYKIFIDHLIGVDDVRNYKKFCDFNERKLIDENDLTKYKTFDQIKNSVSVAEMKIFEKELEKQIIRLFDDNEWLVIKPLTYESSKKYGSNTKWCTSSDSTSSYFLSHTKFGVLIYIINRKNGKKIGIHKDQDRSTTYWNQLGEKIEQSECKLPNKIIRIIEKSLKHDKPNQYYLNNHEDSQTNKKLSKKIKLAVKRENVSDLTKLQVKIKK